MDDRPLTIGAAAVACGLTSRNIRYYEQIGLIPKAARHNEAARTGGNRFYREADLRRLRFIQNSRLLGLGLDDISELLGLFEGGKCPGAQPRYRDKLRQHLVSVKERIDRLETLKTNLERLLSLADIGGLEGSCGCARDRRDLPRTSGDAVRVALPPRGSRRKRSGNGA